MKCSIIISLSESQERMLIVASPENVEDIGKIFEKWDLEYAVIGKTAIFLVIIKYIIFSDLLYSEKMDNLDSPEDYICLPEIYTKVNVVPQKIKKIIVYGQS